MRGNWRWFTFALAAVPAVALAADPEPHAAPAPPPERVPPLKGTPADPAAERLELMGKLNKLIDDVNANGGPKKAGGPAADPPAGKKKGAEPAPAEPGRSIDQVREGMNYFRDGYFVAAQKTFFAIEPSALDPEDRTFVRYMLACSLRRQGKVADAEFIYREVASNKTVEFLAECASSQLTLIRSNQELEAQLEQLRSRAKSK